MQWDSVRVALTLLPFGVFVNVQMLIEGAKSQGGSTQLYDVVLVAAYMFRGV